MPDLDVLPWASASVPKTGNTAAENEDATAADPSRLRFAVADGATEGWQSGGWASHLATAYVRRPPSPADFPRWLGFVRRKWSPPAESGAAPWYAEVKRDQGAFATLVGIEFRRAAKESRLAWKAVAVGDSCLLVLRDGKFEATFPLSSPAEFGNRPPLIPSAADRPCPKPEWLAGHAQPGDLFLLATDAVARYLLGLSPPAPDAPLLAAVREALAGKSPDRLTESLLGLRDALNDDASVLAVRATDLPETPR